MDASKAKKEAPEIKMLIFDMIRIHLSA